ncbi:hypothetical protein NFI96_003967 [Prochilodus magdalenae]|nr:hypothetical protein NFI96_003967 [Prochilodus magdalenae]
MMRVSDALTSSIAPTDSTATSSTVSPTTNATDTNTTTVLTPGVATTFPTSIPTIPDPTTKPGPTTTPDTTAKPGPTTTPDTTAKPGPITTPHTTTIRTSATMPHTTTTPDPPTTPDTTAKPGPTTTPDTTAKPGPTTTPDTTAKPGPTTTPDTTAKPGPTTTSDTTAKPGPTTTSDTTAKPGPTTTPDTTAKPGPTTTPDTTAMPDTTTTPDPTTTPGPITMPHTTTTPDTTAMPDTTTTPDPTTTPGPITMPHTTTTPDPTAMPDTTTTPNPTTTPGPITMPHTTTTPDPTTMPHTTTTANLPTTTTTTASTSATSTTSHSTAAPNCKNNGHPENGVCLCPDDYSGPLCEIRGLPQATARCVNGSFAAPQELLCELTLDLINGNLSMSEANKEQLASSTQILTSKPADLTPQNISSAAQIASILLSSGNVTEGVKLAAVTTISQLLNASAEQFSDTTVHSTSNLTQTLQDFSVNSENAEPAGSLVVQPNLAIQSLKINATGTSEIQFTAFKGLTDTFSPNRIDVTQTGAASHEGFPIDVLMSIKLKNTTDPSRSKAASDAAASDADSDVGFVLYNNDQFFKSKVFEDLLGTKRRVISGNVGKSNLLDSISIRFNMSGAEPTFMTIQDFACVFWDYGRNDWSTEGCDKILNPSNCSELSPILTCSCGHATNFAVLVSFRTNNYKALSLISVIGCALSVSGLVLTILFQILTRKSRRVSPTLLMVSICTCMTIYYLLFIFGTENPNFQEDDTCTQSKTNDISKSSYHVEPDRGSCTAVAALLQYFLLATFTWSALYAAHIAYLIKSIAGPPRHFSTFSILVGWGLPAVIVSISLGVTYRPENPLDYRQEQFMCVCWLAALDREEKFDVRKPMLWGFLLPLTLMLLFNIGVLFYFAYTTCISDASINRSQVSSLRKKMLSCLSLAVVLGLSWTIGYFMLITNDTKTQDILSYIFCLCNTTQGIQIFILFTVRTKVFQKRFTTALKSGPVPEVAKHRKSYFLWATKNKDSPGSYRSTESDIFDQQGLKNKNKKSRKYKKKSSQTKQITESKVCGGGGGGGCGESLAVGLFQSMEREAQSHRAIPELIDLRRLVVALEPGSSYGFFLTQG